VPARTTDVEKKFMKRTSKRTGMDHRRNEEVLKELEIEHVEDKISKCRTVVFNI
jgi:hypothetical protein